MTTIFEAPLSCTADGDEYGIQAERALTSAELSEYQIGDCAGWRFTITKDGSVAGHVPAYITRSLVRTLEENSFSDPVNDDSLAKTLAHEIIRRLQSNGYDFTREEKDRLTRLDTYYDPAAGRGISIRELQEKIQEQQTPPTGS